MSAPFWAVTSPKGVVIGLKDEMDCSCGTVLAAGVNSLNRNILIMTKPARIEKIIPMTRKTGLDRLFISANDP